MGIGSPCLRPTVRATRSLSVPEIPEHGRRWHSFVWLSASNARSAGGSREPRAGRLPSWASCRSSFRSSQPLRGNSLNSRLVAIEEARERDRLAASARAEVRASHAVDDHAASMRHRLRLENVGAVEARDVAVRVNGLPIAEATGVILGGDVTIEAMQPGARFDYRIFTHAGETPPLDVEVEWTDDSGIRGKSRARVRVGR